jgi:hypothetical protein
VAHGQRHEQAVVGHGVVGEAALLRDGTADERDIEPARGDGLAEARGIALLDREVHGRMGFAVAADERRGEAVRGRGAGEAEREVPDRALRRLRAAFPSAGHGGEDRARLVAEDGAALGELHAAREPAEEREAQLALEVAHLLRQRRLADAERLRRAREVAVLGHREEVAQVPQLHGGLSICNKYRNGTNNIFYRVLRRVYAGHRR